MSHLYLSLSQIYTLETVFVLNEVSGTDLNYDGDVKEKNVLAIENMTNVSEYPDTEYFLNEMSGTDFSYSGSEWLPDELKDSSDFDEKCRVYSI